jgi:hypothetical protein
MDRKLYIIGTIYIYNVKGFGMGATDDRAYL